MILLKSKILIHVTLLLTILLISCKSSQKIDCHNVQKLRFAYLPKGVTSPNAISDCHKLFGYSPSLRDTTITDEIKICDFVDRINSLSIADSLESEDYRILCLIFVKGKKNPIKICFGEGYLINYNKTQMQYSKELFDFLDKLLYCEN